MSVASKVIAAHRGEDTLAATYWLWYVLPLALFNVAEKSLSFNSISLLLISPALYDGLEIGLLVGYVGWLYYFGVGVLRSAKSSQSSRWAGLAKFFVILAFVAVPIQMADAWFGPTDNNEIARGLETMNAQFPKRVDPITTIEHVEYAGGEIHYRYTIDDSAVDRMNWELLKQNIIKTACASWISDFKNGTVSKVTYGYTSAGGKYLQTLTLAASDCS